MNVLYITNIPAPYRVAFWNELGEHCDLTVWFESVNESDREWRIENLGLNFNYRFLKGVTFGIDKHLNLSIIKELNSQKFDVYILGSYSSPTEILALHWLKFNKIPFILNSDGGFPAKENTLKKYLKRYLISSASAWLSSGKNCTEYLMYYGATVKKIYEYPFSSVNFTSEELTPLMIEQINCIKGENNLKEVVLLSIGRFIELKGFDILIKAFKSLESTHVSLLLIGGGPLKKDYENLINSYNLKNVVIKDFMHKDELLKYLKIADIFILPTRNDVWGLVINEAVQCALPIIATNRAGAAYDLVIENENGYVVECDNIEELKEKCFLLINNREKRKIFGLKSHELSQKYTIKNMVAKHLEVLNNFQ